MPPPSGRYRLLILKSGPMEKVVVLKFAVCTVLLEVLVDERPPVWRCGDEMDVLYGFPVPVQSYHHAGCGYSAAAGHHEVFNLVREIFRLRRDCGEERIPVVDEVDAVLDDKAVFLCRQLFCAGV